MILNMHACVDRRLQLETSVDCRNLVEYQCWLTRSQCDGPGTPILTIWTSDVTVHQTV